MKAPLILIISEKMDNNKKKDRYEDKLIRMGEKARDVLGLKDEKTVELWPDGPALDRISRSKVLEIFQAYSSDLSRAKASMPENDYNHVGFVTSRIFDFICRDKRKKKENIWIADTIEDTAIGADPEFILMTGDGSMKYAAEVAGFSHTDILGSDGPLAEIRPTPETNVEAFVDNIQDILRGHKNTDLIKEYQWIGGCYHRCRREGGDNTGAWAIGGHVHIGTPGKLAKAIDNSGGHSGYSIYSCLNKLLDEYVAMPMMRVDGVSDAIKRRSQYGYYGDVRTDHGRLEYRALSGEWLTHPEMARMVIGTTKAIAHAFFKILDETDYKKSMFMTKAQQDSHSHDNFRFFDNTFNGWKDIEIMRAFSATRSSERMHSILHKGAMDFNKPFFKSLSKKLKSLSTYKEYSRFIDAFIELSQLPEEMLKARDKDLKHTWVGNEEFII